MRRKRKNSKHENWDYYAMLELQDLRWRATAADIKDAFKRVSLRHVDARGASRDARRVSCGGAARCCAVCLQVAWRWGRRGNHELFAGLTPVLARHLGV